MASYQLSSPREDIHIHGAFHYIEGAFLFRCRLLGFLDSNPLQVVIDFYGAIVLERKAVRGDPDLVQ